MIRSTLTALFANVLACRTEMRQASASFLISAMLLPALTLPVNAGRFPVAGPDGPSGLLGMAREMWSDAKLKYEEWETPLRAANREFRAAGPSGAAVPGEGKEIAPDGPEKEIAGKPSEVAEPSGNEDDPTEPAEAEAGVKPTTRVAAPHVNQLPTDERESVYGAQNNLGSPPGQTELDSTNEPAAVRVRHRAGSANFSFSLPLAALAGRGIDAGIGLTYNSRTWNKSCTTYSTQPPNDCIENHFTYDVDQSWIAPGFVTGLGHIDSSAEVRNVIVDAPNNNWQTEIVPLGITDPDGTRHQFTCIATTPIPGTLASRCSLYETTDGTRIRLTGRPYTDNPNNSPHPYTANYGSARWETTLPGGTRVWYTGGNGAGAQRKHYPYQIRDRNGNIVRIQYRNDQSGRIDFITDTIGRRIKFHYETDANGNPDKLVAVSIPGMGASEEIQTVRFYYEEMQLNAAGKFTGQITAPASVRVLRWLYMPATGTAYKYHYNPNYGMIQKIERRVGVTVSDPTATTATGTVTGEGAWAATTEYDYPDGSAALADVPKYYKRTDDWAGRTAATPAYTHYDVTEPSGGYRYSRITVEDGSFNVQTESKTNATTGMLAETTVKKIYGSAGQYSTLMSKSEYTWDNGRNLTKLEVTNEAGLKKKTEFEYDQYGNQKTIREYDYFPAAGSPALLRTTELTYETGAGWIDKNLTDLVKSVMRIVGGVTVSKTLYEYDHNGDDGTLVRRADMDISVHDVYYNPSRPGWTEQVCPYSELSGDGCVTVHHPGYNASSVYRGNLTKVTRFADATLATDPNADVTEYNYDIAGNTVSATLSCCQLKTLEYGANYAEAGYAFATKETKGSSPQLVNEFAYDKSTGLLLSSTDENGQTTNYEYEADTLRPRKTIWPNGGHAETEYSDKLVSNPADMVPGFVRHTTTLEANKFAQSYGYFDGRGLGIRSASQTSDGWSVSAVEYDHLGRARKTYNPFYGAAPTAAVPAGTKAVEVTGIDALGRTTNVKFQDGTTASTGFSSSAPAGFPRTWAIATDQAGKQRRQVFDALGRVVRLDEPDASGQLGAVDAPAQATVYEYDGNDNLSKVIQSDGTVTQERRFRHDSLSRLTHERQAEAAPTLDDAGVKGTPSSTKWTKVLKYNLDGLVSEGVDARGVRATFSYDGLNRVTSIVYSGETGYQTPAVAYTYDQARSGFHNAGALTRVETAAVGEAPATATEFDYDQMGRVQKHRQWVAGQQYDLEYNYNLAGQLTGQKYPSGRVVAMGYDAGGRPTAVADASRSYVTGMQYQGKGNSVSQISFGNGTVQNLTLNDRLQMSGQELKKGTTVLQKYDYGYGQIDAAGNLDAAKNNGQLGRVESHIGAAKQWTQKFSYDAIGRLKQSEERRGDTDALTYKQSFDFDRFGNMYRKAANNPAAGQENPLPYTPIENSDINKSTNRFTTDTTYDEAGNVVTDDKFRGMGFGYDANGRMVRATKLNAPDAASVYDASGMRVAERVNDAWRFLVHDIGGKLVAEYGGPPSTDEGGVKYVLSDWQGSTRATLSNSGFVQSRADYTAFGESVGAGTGLRTAQQGFGASDTLRQRYGQTERDDATGLDHTLFRKNDGQAGRFTSPDPYNGSANLGSGQSWNRYSYVENDPVNFVDPSGLNASGCSAEYSYGQCGGDAGFWGMMYTSNSGWGGGGGGFGDAVAYHNQTFGGLSSEVAAALDLHLQRISNSQAGYGFRTHAEVAAATFWISYWYDDAGNLHTSFVLQATFHYTELAMPRGALNDRAKALFDDLGRRGPALQKITNAIGAGSLAIVAAPVVADALLAAAATNITFTSHGAAHAAAEGFSRTAAEGAIRVAVQNIAGRVPMTEFWGKVSVGGTTIIYRAFTLADGSIRIGTYYDPTKK